MFNKTDVTTLLYEINVIVLLLNVCLVIYIFQLNCWGHQ